MRVVFPSERNAMHGTRHENSFRIVTPFLLRGRATIILKSGWARNYDCYLLVIPRAIRTSSYWHHATPESLVLITSLHASFLIPTSLHVANQSSSPFLIEDNMASEIREIILAPPTGVRLNIPRRQSPHHLSHSISSISHGPVLNL